LPAAHNMQHSSTISPQIQAADAAANTIKPAAEPLKLDNDKASLQGISIQRKLSIGAADDPLEREADAMADKVMRKPETALVQRKCNHCEEEQVQMKPLAPSITQFIQTKSENGGTASDRVINQINATRGSGSPMEGPTQSFMKSRFGTDFSGVKIHTGTNAVQMSRELNAQAFTVGNDIYFNSGKYNPSSDSGRHLLAHELTHTMQQGRGIGRKIQKRDMIFEPAVIAVQLRNAMEILGTDEEAIYAALAGRTAAQQTAIAAAYRTLTGRELQTDLEDELTGGELLLLAQYRQFTGKGDTPENRAAAVAVQLRDALAAWDTDENAIYMALQGRSQAELQLIQTEYETLTKRKLLGHMEDELTEDEMNIARSTMGFPPVLKETDTELGMLSVGNFDFNFTDCAIEINVRVKFQFTSDIVKVNQDAFKTRFIDVVHKKWQNSGYKLVGGTSCPCDEIPITINVAENDSDYHKVVDVEDKTDMERRPGIMRDINVNLNTHDIMLMHEFGHVLGLYDEYDGGLGENFMWWHRNRPDDSGSLMNHINPDGTENFEVGLRPRFFEHYQRAANRTASFNCNYIIAN
jgi:Domain of unknown function (DUF4157)/Annexin